MINICKLCHKQFKTKVRLQKYCSLLHAYADRSKDKYLKIQTRLKEIPIEFLIWFTGFWEGEGCLISHGRYYCLTISQKDYSIMKYIKATFGFGTAKKHSNTKQNFTWNLFNCGEILALIERMEPYRTKFGLSLADCLRLWWFRNVDQKKCFCGGAIWTDYH